MKIFLDDTNCKKSLVPFSLTRNVSNFRIGILTIKEKWEILVNNQFEIITDQNTEAIKIESNLLPSIHNFSAIINSFKNNDSLPHNIEINKIEHPWQLFQLNDIEIRNDFELLIKNKTTASLSQTNKVIGNPQLIFVEEGVNAQYCTFNTTTGPIYLGKNATIMEGSMIRGPFALLGNSVVKMGSKIYGATTIGPNCVVGGEIKNSIFFENSNKAHDGYLGDSVIGAWCNLGAGTTNSNVKNTGSEVKFKIDENTLPVSCGFKGGLLMGDYSRSAINTSFNTGTVIGVCCNIFGNTYPDKYVKHFSWGQDRYVFEKAINDIENWKKMKNQKITDSEKETLKQLYYK